MRIIGNILWYFLFLGFFSALLNFIVGILFVITIIGAPIGFGLIQYAKFLILPFSYAMVSKDDLEIEQNTFWKHYSFIIKIIYFPFGVIAVFVGIIQVIGLCFTVVGIPAALVIANSLSTYFQPVGKVCVPFDVANEIRYRKAINSYLD